mmetsp:Transcript_21042/g.58780  ORF Transcript_21042/g.58780 Transcript_21042/m.58780 type:complete len:252 (-) Transcript_21042:501-1256(-)
MYGSMTPPPTSALRRCIHWSATSATSLCLAPRATTPLVSKSIWCVSASLDTRDTASPAEASKRTWHCSKVRRATTTSSNLSVLTYCSFGGNTSAALSKKCRALSLAVPTSVFATTRNITAMSSGDQSTRLIVATTTTGLSPHSSIAAEDFAAEANWTKSRAGTTLNKGPAVATRLSRAARKSSVSMRFSPSMAIRRTISASGSASMAGRLAATSSSSTPASIKADNTFAATGAGARLRPRSSAFAKVSTTG